MTVSGVVLYTTSKENVLAEKPIDCSTFNKYMSHPITDKKILEKNSTDMKSKMEHLILKIQVGICLKYLFLFKITVLI